MGEDGSLVMETARACPDLLVREGAALAGASVKDDDDVIRAGGKNEAGPGTGDCWKDRGWG